jgi:hypothetical protein
MEQKRSISKKIKKSNEEILESSIKKTTFQKEWE